MLFGSNCGDVLLQALLLLWVRCYICICICVCICVCICICILVSNSIFANLWKGCTCTCMHGTCGLIEQSSTSQPESRKKSQPESGKRKYTMNYFEICSKIWMYRKEFINALLRAVLIEQSLVRKEWKWMRKRRKEEMQRWDLDSDRSIVRAQFYRFARFLWPFLDQSSTFTDSKDFSDLF